MIIKFVLSGAVIQSIAWVKGIGGGRNLDGKKLKKELREADETYVVRTKKFQVK